LDGARALISAGYSPDALLVGWRKGNACWALRARLGEAAKLTVDEAKTCFARWKPFSSSAVAAAVSSFREDAVSLAQPTDDPSNGAPDHGSSNPRIKPAPAR
jgi:hypothetical protein